MLLEWVISIYVKCKTLGTLNNYDLTTMTRKNNNRESACYMVDCIGDAD